MSGAITTKRNTFGTMGRYQYQSDQTISTFQRKRYDPGNH
jgi:hypothetical protein